MDIQDILTIMDRFDESTMTRIQIKNENMELNIEKNVTVIAPAAEAPAPSTHVLSAAPAPVEHKTPQEDGFVIKSPLVGIYYEASSPDAPPFKKPGDPVKAGEVVCILEAMKVFNEIKSPWDGIVADILVTNQDIVEFDQPLMVIERS